MARQPGTADRRDDRGTRTATPEGADPVRERGRASESPFLIVTADDFGSSEAVNRAVAEAHARGILTSASLMVTGAAFAEAVALARSHPRLSIGLHLVLVQGRAAAPPGRVPHLASAAGRLPDDPVRLGLRLAFDPRLRQEVTVEIEAQLARFAATGLPLSHVDGHLNFHMHPAVFPLLTSRAAAMGAVGVRLPRDDLRLALRHDRSHLGSKLLWAAAFGPLSSWARGRLPYPLQASDRVFGLFQSGRITVPYVLDALGTLRPGQSAELYLHPAATPGDEPLGPNPVDLATLLDPTVASAVAVTGVRLGTYAELGAR
ncbi:MAG: hopanoid biosynthesis-associated protein HpnK [Deinococcales bacterium]